VIGSCHGAMVGAGPGVTVRLIVKKLVKVKKTLQKRFSTFF